MVVKHIHSFTTNVALVYGCFSFQYW